MPSDQNDQARLEVGSAAGLFVLLWETLSNIFGTAATATLIARAMKRALPSTPGLAELLITTKNFTYDYRLPEAGGHRTMRSAMAAFDRLLEELIPLLTTLTGHVVVRQLARLEPFAAKGLLVETGAPAMNTGPAVAELSRLRTGVDALDSVLGGGFPTLSTTIISGEPGTGKTVLMLQILFHLARQGKKCLYFTTVSEPAIKLIRHMQLFSFFDPDAPR